MPLFVPKESIVEIHCVPGVENTTQTGFWSIDLASDSQSISFQFSTGKEQLHSYNVYDLSPIETPGMRPTLRLLINDTAVNNQTNIQCFYGTVVTTKLHVFSKLLLIAIVT